MRSLGGAHGVAAEQQALELDGRGGDSPVEVITTKDDLSAILDKSSTSASESIVAGKGGDPTTRLGVLEARKQLTWILPHGLVVFSGHARREMDDDDLNEPDVVNILRAGMIADAPDFERGTWRYRVETDRMCAVVSFNGRSEVVVVTVWRKKGRGR